MGSDLGSEVKFSVEDDLGVGPPGVEVPDWFGDLWALPEAEFVLELDLAVLVTAFPSRFLHKKWE